MANSDSSTAVGAPTRPVESELERARRREFVITTVVTAVVGLLGVGAALYAGYLQVWNDDGSSPPPTVASPPVDEEADEPTKSSSTTRTTPSTTTETTTETTTSRATDPDQGADEGTTEDPGTPREPAAPAAPLLWEGPLHVVIGGSADLDVRGGGGRPDISLSPYISPLSVSFESYYPESGYSPAVGFEVPTADFQTCQSIDQYSFSTRDIVLSPGLEFCVVTAEGNLAGVRVEAITSEAVDFRIAAWGAPVA